MSVRGGFSTRMPKVSSTVKSSVSTGSNSDGDFYGRVLDVITSPSHPDYKKYGGSQALYGVFYQKLFQRMSDRVEDTPRQFAYCINPTLRRVPVKNEIVRLTTTLSSDSSDDLSRHFTKLYWTEIIGLWNSPHLNAYPDTVKYSGKTLDTGKNFEEQSDIRPLLLTEGDVALEGRYGNSIHFGGTKGDGSISSSSSNGKPFIMIRNGQGSSNGDVTSENPDKDGSSIYLLSDHNVDITEARDKRDAWKKNPKRFKGVRGNQIILDSSRIVLNAKDEDVQIASKGDFGVVADVVGVDGEQYVAFDAKKIYLGKDALNERQPVLLGQKTITWLTDLISYLTMLLTAMQMPPIPYTWDSGVSVAAGPVNQGLQQLLGKLEELKSKKVYTE